MGSRLVVAAVVATVACATLTCVHACRSCEDLAADPTVGLVHGQYGGNVTVNGTNATNATHTWCGATRLYLPTPDTPGCSGYRTHAAAQTWCTGAGMVLCPHEHVGPWGPAMGATEGTGCGYDLTRVWTATPCGEAATVATAYWTVPGHREAPTLPSRTAPWDPHDPGLPVCVAATNATMATARCCAGPAVCATERPSTSPTASPTGDPTASPTVSPTASPTASPTVSPTASPTARPTDDPTASPTVSPSITKHPSGTPTQAASPPSAVPTETPTTTATAAAALAPTPPAPPRTVQEWLDLFRGINGTANADNNDPNDGRVSTGGWVAVVACAVVGATVAWASTSQRPLRQWCTCPSTRRTVPLPLRVARTCDTDEEDEGDEATTDTAAAAAAGDGCTMDSVE